jgi:hypothetical protein
MSDHHRAPAPQEEPAPTSKQQAYIRKLALARGVSFTPPRTAQRGVAPHRRPQAPQPEAPSDRRRELRGVQADLAGRGDAARVRAHELDGYGSSATWKERA